MMSNKNKFAEKALAYHRMNNKPGKIAITATKPLVSQQDLALAYSPGVAEPCLAIQKNPEDVYEYTSKGNMVAVISNGTAVLGLGNLGAAASKPVMEGKAVLFKKFADIDAIDIEVDTNNIDEFVNSVKYLGKSWGGINLEDIKAPECFVIEQKLQKLMDIPVFHDDQHGTAIITAAAIINALYLTNRKIENSRIVINGAGAAAIACANLIKKMGASAKNIIMCDTKGVIYHGRKEGMNEWKELQACDTHLRTLSEAMKNADVFIGLSVKGAVTQDMVKSMAAKPIIFALANPDPEITPDDVRAVSKDAIIATGRSDFNNQVNNVMGFPYIFRGALDVRAKEINLEMQIAAANSLAMLARKPVPSEVSIAYSGSKLKFGPEYIIPVPFDPRLITTIPVAVAEAAINSGVANKKNIDLKKYQAELESRLNPASNYMNWLFDKMRANPRKVVFADGEEEEVIKAAILMDENRYGTPILIGREERINPILKSIKGNSHLGGIKILNAAITDKIDQYIEYLYKKLQRKGYLIRDIARMVKRDRNIFAACVVANGDGDFMVTGHTRDFMSSLTDIRKVIDARKDHIIFSYSILLSDNAKIIIADNKIHEMPSSEELADITVQTADIARQLGYNPRAALLSFSTFGSKFSEKSERIRQAVDILNSRKLDFEYDGEMTADIALNKGLMKLYPFCKLSDTANILIMPALNTASISTDLIKELAGGVFIGPIITGLEHSVQIVEIGSNANHILNFAAIAAVSNNTNFA